MEKLVLPVQYVSIEEECKRNPELKISDLQMLKDWMDKQPHLPQIEMFYLITFLHSNYYCIEPTKRTIENFFTVRTHVPELFSNRDPVAWKGLRKAFNTVACVPLKQKTKEGYTITFGQILDPNPSEFNAAECIKYFLMSCEIQHIIEGTTNGTVVVFDTSGFSFSHITQFNLLIIKKLAFYVQEAAPVRLKALHLLNTKSAVEAVVNMFKPLFKIEIFKLLHFHSNLETVKEFLPIEILPNEVGGQAGPIKKIADDHIKLMEEFREWFQYDEFVGHVDESLRVGKCEVAENLFGVEGSFKKLEID